MRGGGGGGFRNFNPACRHQIYGPAPNTRHSPHNGGWVGRVEHTFVAELQLSMPLHFLAAWKLFLIARAAHGFGSQIIFKLHPTGCQAPPSQGRGLACIPSLC